jgi:hypothetical protein
MGMYIDASSTQVAWSRGMVMICEMITAAKFWSHQNNNKKKDARTFDAFIKPVLYPVTYRRGQLRLEPACQWHWTRKARHWNGHRQNHMAKIQTALNNHKGRNEWWQRTRRQRAGPTAVAAVGDAGRHGSRPSRSWRTPGGAGGETLAVTRGQPAGEWLSEMRGPRFGIWSACSCVGVCPRPSLVRDFFWKIVL